LRRLTLRFHNRLAVLHTLGGDKAPRRVKREAAQQVSVEGTLLLQNQGLFQEFVDQSERRLLLAFRGETVATSYAALLTLDVPRLRFREFKPALSRPGQLEVSFAASGVYDQGSGYALRATLTNTLADY
jgi:hypothetical protein